MNNTHLNNAPLTVEFFDRRHARDETGRIQLFRARHLDGTGFDYALETAHSPLVAFTEPGAFVGVYILAADRRCADGTEISTFVRADVVAEGWNR
ncbi:hypothetical protein [Plantibacter sp. YIM 135249]|uniref:hypothetical protein n=1 Tax=Plantibacter sp. YIM 135249 TaxID=3423918 RepID=UPI003D34E3D6